MPIQTQIPLGIPGQGFQPPQQNPILPAAGNLFSPNAPVVDPLTQGFPQLNLGQNLFSGERTEEVSTVLAQAMEPPLADDFLKFLIGQPGLQVQVPGASPQAAPAPAAAPELKQGPPADEKELANRKTGWTDLLAKMDTPEMKETLMRFGAQMLQPKAYGQTTAGQFGQALTGAMDTHQAAQARRAKGEQAKELLRLKTEEGKRAEKAAPLKEEKLKAEAEALRRGKPVKPGAEQQLLERTAQAYVTRGDFPDSKEGKAEALIFVRNLPKPKSRETKAGYMGNVVAKLIEQEAMLGKGIDDETIANIRQQAQTATDIAYPDEAKKANPGVVSQLQQMQATAEQQGQAYQPGHRFEHEGLVYTLGTDGNWTAQ